MHMRDKILGGLLGGALGDAMGAVTETRTPRQIKERFGGYVRDLVTPPADCYARGMPAGHVTDDFSLAYFTLEEIVNANGQVTDQVAKNALLEWRRHPEFYDNFAGPTTRNGLDKLEKNTTEENAAFTPACDNGKATNGSAMKIAPIGFLSPGDLETTINHVFTICKPTHYNDLALSGACAVACAVSRAAEPDADIYSMLQAGLYGAKRGYDKAQQVGAAEVAGPSVEKRMRLALEIAIRSNSNWEETMLELGDVIGAGLHISEAVPCAFGIIGATAANPMQSIYMGVNIGNDTDTIATIAGAMAGALQGIQAFPEGYLDIIDNINGFDLAGLADRLYECAD